MKLAIISDIHANMEAFSQVLSDIDASGIDRIISLGDNIGYGPEPEEVVGLIQSRHIPSIMGNHELAVANDCILKYFNPLARLSIQKTLAMLSEKSVEFICGLEYFSTADDCRFVHGFPPESVTTYLFKVPESTILNVFSCFEERFCFIGHTHTLELVSFDGSRIVHETLHEGLLELKPDSRYIINCGSVGQPRDLNNNAKYLILDTEKCCIEVRFIPYDISTVADKIIAAGLPKEHAIRLW